MLMDKDDSGSLSHQEILGAVKTNAEVKKFLNDCGDRNLQYLLMPSKLEASLKAIDSDGSGEIDYQELRAGLRKPALKRGGEQVSPYEVEEVLQKHPWVQVAVACGVPNDFWGEEVAAAIVLKEAPEPGVW